MSFLDFINIIEGRSGLPKRKYPRHDLGRSSLRTVHMVFAYMPSGPKVVTGSMDRISDHFKDVPSSHAALCTKTGRSYEFMCFTVVGKYQQTNYSKNKFYMNLVSGCKYEPPTDFFVGDRIEWEPYLTSRKRQFLVKVSDRKIEVIKSWRKLPKKHLRELAFLDNPELIKRNKETRFTRLEF